jgi:CRP-like cAMP-binding protein
MPRPAAGDVLAFLRASPVFADLPARDLDTLAQAAREEPCAPREYVFHEGEPAAWFCLVRSGRIRIVRHASSGKDVVLELLGPGEIFGGVAVLERRPYPASAQATEPSVVVRIPADPVLALAERQPSIARTMMLLISRRLRAAHEAVKSLSVDSVDARLATTLLRLADRDGVPIPEGIELPFHLTRKSLAEMSGTTVETAIRVVSRWLREALVVDRQGRLVVRDREALRQIAAGGTE